MKRTFFSLLLIAVCSAFVFPANVNNEVKDDLEDKIALSREGGTTRVASRMFSLQAVPVEPVVEAYNYRNVVAITVQNYRGSAWVEIVGNKGAKQSFFEVYDMGFDAISLGGLPAGEYTIRITLGTEVFTGTFNKGKYGKN
ncbi:hypothetical protein [Proteiniphilum sp. UBA1028]|jgi:predicted dinucleotide-binding enzyme|uniref:hypothetical protein n=1 Tax=Proteiniphilum sp. UBA1028 TaxID=1947251 RepID=UPI0025FD8F2E|nr:hypothetical protein [Proteiniphilum sp. UBA1028]